MERMKISRRAQNGLTILRMENRCLALEVAPEVGGRILKLWDNRTGYQFLWKNPNLELEKLPAGSEYDPNFYGGIDELIPNDMPETVNGIDYPDHGELWTLSLQYELTPDGIQLDGVLPLSELSYHREIHFNSEGTGIILNYRIGNLTNRRRDFLWKLHAAMNLEPGDEILCPARTAMVVDPQWSKWTDSKPFPWPEIQKQRADIIPPADGTMDFLYLYDLQEGRMGWRRSGRNLAFEYQFDPAVFPYCWYFASYGGFFGHYTGVLEPCTAMPCSVNEASKLGQCSVLEPSQSFETTVHINAGTADTLKQIGGIIP